jgi:hypothetical protein
MKEQLKFAKKQRLISLKMAFKIIDCFAIPSLSPDSFTNYESIKKELIKNYSK